MGALPASSVAQAPEQGSAGWPQLVSLKRAVRPQHWLHFMVLPVASWDPAAPLGVSLTALARGALICAAVLAFGYLINTISDRDLDRDARKNPLVGVAKPSALHYAVAAALPWVALVAAWLSPTPVLYATLTAISAGTLYSVGPRLKSLPGVGSLLNVGCFAPLLLLGLSSETVPEARWLLVTCFSLLLLQNQLIHEAADAEDDRGGGVRTTFQLLGARATALLLGALGLLLLGVSVELLRRSAAPLWLAAYAAPFVLWFPWALMRRAPHRSHAQALRVQHRIASAASCALLLSCVLVW